MEYVAACDNERKTSQGYMKAYGQGDKRTHENYVRVMESRLKKPTE